MLRLSEVSDSATPWTIASQASLSMGILQARTLEWVAMPPPGDFCNSGTEPGLSRCSQILDHLSHQGNPIQKPIANNWFCCGLRSGEIRNRGRYFYFLIKKMWSNIFVNEQKVSLVSPKKGWISNLLFSIELANHKRLFLLYSFCYLIVSSKAI